MGKVILIVEDNEINMTLFREILQMSGYTTLEAGDGKKAVEIAKKKKPDLILMDIQLPGMNGLDATKILKNDPLTSDIKILAITAMAMKGDKERILQSGCDDYIAKPIYYKNLLAKIQSLITQ